MWRSSIKKGYPLGGPHSKHYRILGSMLGSPYAWKLPYRDILDKWKVAYHWDSIGTTIRVHSRLTTNSTCVSRINCCNELAALAKFCCMTCAAFLSNGLFGLALLHDYNTLNPYYYYYYHSHS